MRNEATPDTPHAEVHLYIALIDACLDDETPLVHSMDYARASQNRQ